MTEIDGYTDLQMIGRGGFAVVYQALQVSTGRHMAIKLLTDPSPDDDLVRRFKRESRAVGALSWHPYIAAVVDAVEAAHRADVLHRDIKPANILLDRLGVAKLGDFDIASMQDGNKTATATLATTIAHAAPELFDGHPASPAADIYALGSTLHTLVTPLPPVSHGEDERISTVIARIASEPPPRPNPAQVPGQVATISTHALAKQPQYRPRSAAAFGQALQQVQRELGRQVTAMAVTDSEPVTAPRNAPFTAVPQAVAATPAKDSARRSLRPA